MPAVWKTLSQRATLFVSIATVLVFFAFTRPLELDAGDRSQLASQFSFARSELREPGTPTYKTVRRVHPSFQRISAWLSALGAAVALADLDGDGLSNDLCRVEPRTDQVVVQTAPGTGDRYATFALDPAPLPYEATAPPIGCLAADLNEDGLMDLLVAYAGRTPIAFLRNTGAPGQRSAISSPDFVRAEIVPNPGRWNATTNLIADVDGDGHLDLLFGSYFREDARLYDPDGAGTETLHNALSKSFNGGHKHLLLWEGGTAAPSATVRFREVADVFSSEVDRGWTLASGAADLDRDMLPELYFGHDFGPDRLLHNRSTPGHPKFVALEGRRDFTTPPSSVLGHDSFKGMGLDFGDVNGDGIFDMYVSNISADFGLQESHFLWVSTGDVGAMKNGAAPYRQGSEAAGLARSGWGWDTRLADLNDDGKLEALQATGFIKGTVNRWPELQALGTANDELMTDPSNWPSFRPGADISGHDQFAFFARDRAGRFWNIAPDVGFGEPMVSRGIAIGDVDGDGRLDFAVANQWEPSWFYRNDSPAAGSFLGLHLLLPLRAGDPTRTRPLHPGPDLYGRPAVGAVARILLPNGTTLIGQVDGGSGHSGKRSPDVHFGLGAIGTDAQLEVEVTWRDPSGQVRTHTFSLTPGWHTVVLGWPLNG